MNSEPKQIKLVPQNTHSFLQKMRTPIISRVLPIQINGYHSKLVDGISELRVMVKMVTTRLLSDSPTTQLPMHTTSCIIKRMSNSSKKVEKCFPFMMLTWVVAEPSFKECNFTTVMDLPSYLPLRTIWTIEYSRSCFWITVNTSRKQVAVVSSQPKHTKRMPQSTNSLLQQIRTPITSRVLPIQMNGSHSKLADGISERNKTVKMDITRLLSDSPTTQLPMHTTSCIMKRMSNSSKKVEKCSPFMMLTWVVAEPSFKEFNFTTVMDLPSYRVPLLPLLHHLGA